MSIVNVEALKHNGCVLHWSGESAVSGTYDDDGNKRGFFILPDGVTVTPSGTFTTQKMKDGRLIYKFDGSTNYISLSDHDAWNLFENDFTICIWFKPDSNITARLFNQSYDISNYWNINYAGNGHFAITAKIANALILYYYCAFVATPNVWYFATITKTGGIYREHGKCI